MFFNTKALIDLEKKYHHSSALLSSEIKVMLDRLSTIANRNILYASLYNELDLKCTKIINDYEQDIHKALENLNDFKNKRNYKGFHSIFATTKTMVFTFVKEVEQLHQELDRSLSQEDETRNKSYRLKENIRLFKEQHRAVQNEMSLINDSFDTVYANIDNSLKKLDDLIESADYAEANNLISKLYRLLEQLKEILKEAPRLCLSIEKIIPDKIFELKDEAERMNKNRFPVHHLLINSKIETISQRLQALTMKIQKLEIMGIADEINAHLDTIKAIYPQFELEKEAKNAFNSEYEKTDKAASEVERAFFKLNTELPKLKLIYQINNEQLEKLAKVKEAISKIHLTKRALDTLVLSPTLQPYTLRMNKINELKQEHRIALMMIDSFENYLKSLKEDTEEAFHLINPYFLKLKQAEAQVRKLGVNQFNQEVKVQFDLFYDSLLTIANTLKATPIDVDTVNHHANILKKDANEVISCIEKQHHMAQRAEAAIVLANKERHRLSDYHRLLTVAEDAFFKGSFEKSYTDAGNLLNKINEQLSQK